MTNINSRNFLGYIVKESPNHLNTFTNIGYQSYFVHKDESHEMEKMFFETLRLGFRNNVQESEAYLRNSDIITFDLSSIRQLTPPPLFSLLQMVFCNEACILSYAGM